MIHKGFTEFRFGYMCINDAERSGGSNVATTSKMIEKSMIVENRKVKMNVSNVLMNICIIMKKTARWVHFC